MFGHGLVVVYITVAWFINSHVPLTVYLTVIGVKGNWFMDVYFHSPIIFFIAVGHTTKHMMHDVHYAPF